MVDIQCGNCKYWTEEDCDDVCKDEDGPLGYCLYRKRFTLMMQFCKYFAAQKKKTKP